MLKCEVMYRSAPCPVTVRFDNQVRGSASLVPPNWRGVMSPIDQQVGVDQPIVPVAISVGGSAIVEVVVSPTLTDRSRVCHIAPGYLVIRVGSIEYHISDDRFDPSAPLNKRSGAAQ